MSKEELAADQVQGEASYRIGRFMYRSKLMLHTFPRVALRAPDKAASLADSHNDNFICMSFPGLKTIPRWVYAPVELWDRAGKCWIKSSSSLFS